VGAMDGACGRVTLRQLTAGEAFTTCLTGRRGVVLEPQHDHGSAVLCAFADGEQKHVCGAVLVEVDAST
jgi:hypothetical protein